MTKSELIALLVKRQSHLLAADVVAATRHLLDQISSALARGDRIEIRGFGSFRLRFRQPRLGHNPKTRAAVAMPGRYFPHFKPGIELRARINGAFPRNICVNGAHGHAAAATFEAQSAGTLDALM